MKTFSTNSKSLWSRERDTRQTACIRFSQLFLHAWLNIKVFLENKAMYSEGEDRYLKDLDWVSIVKSIRELKAYRELF